MGELNRAMAEEKKEEFTMQQDLLDMAEKFKGSAGVISDAEAHKLWESACDGPGVTQNEFKTLEHIMKEYKFTDKASKYLTKLVTKTPSGSSYYKQIDGVKYDRACLDLAEHLMKDEKLDLADAKLLWEDVEDGPGVTACEKAPIEYIMEKHTLTEGAKKFLEESIAALPKEEEKGEKRPAEEEAEAPAAKEAKTEEAETDSFETYQQRNSFLRIRSRKDCAVQD